MVEHQDSSKTEPTISVGNFFHYCTALTMKNFFLIFQWESPLLQQNPIISSSILWGNREYIYFAFLYMGSAALTQSAT